MLKKIIFFILILCVSLFFAYKYLYKEHRNIENEQTVYLVEGSNLINEFSINFELATEKYLDKTIQIDGQVTHVDDNFITVNNNVICYLKDKNSKELLNHYISVKGRCIGYDELLEEVKIDECTIIN